MATGNLRDVPIVLQTLPHTGKLQGDDGKGVLLPGYRDFGFIPEDATDPDRVCIIFCVNGIIE